MSNGQPGDKIRMAIKYCGGCNPAYDRVAAVAELLTRLTDVVAVVPLDDQRADLLVAVEGCPTACADLSGFKGKRVVVLTSREAVEGFMPEVGGQRTEDQ